MATVVTDLSRPEAEEYIIGASLLDHTVALKLDYLTGQDFTAPYRPQFWEVIKKLARAGDPLDAFLVAQKVADAYSDIDADDAENALLGMAIRGASPELALTYANVVLEFSRRRALVYVAQEAAKLALSQDPEKAVDHLVQRLLKITHGRGGTPLVRNYADALSDYISELEEVSKNPDSNLRTHYRDLDAMMGGIKPQELIYVAGRPGMGKSAFGAGLAKRAASHFQRSGTGKVLHITLEMSISDIISRNLAAYFTPPIPTSTIRSGFRNGDEIDHTLFTKAYQFLGLEEERTRGTYLYSDQPTLTLQDIALMLIQNPTVRVVIIDQLTNMTIEARDERDGLSKLSKGLKQLAKKYGVVIFCLTQFNRDTDKREGSRPGGSNIYGSDRMFQDADMVLGLHRPAYYLPEDPGDIPFYQNYAELIIIKGRNGRTGTIPLWWMPESSQYTDWPDTTDAEEMRQFVEQKEGM
jgi:replicative DNA helicase